MNPCIDGANGTGVRGQDPESAWTSKMEIHLEEAGSQSLPEQNPTIDQTEYTWLPGLYEMLHLHALGSNGVGQTLGAAYVPLHQRSLSLAEERVIMQGESILQRETPGGSK